MRFEDFRLHPDLLRGLRDMGYTEPTPIQAQAIPPALEGRDVIGIAQTGTGKTAAFLIPILQRLLERPSSAPATRALVIAPTRELALQIDEVRIGLSYHTSLSGCAVYGGADMLLQTRWLRGHPDVVTATPGRLLDHLWHGLPALERLEVLVLDEADRMLDMGFLPDIEKIVRRLPEQRQNLLFSATMPAEIERLARSMMCDPVRIAVGRVERPVDQVEQVPLRLAPDEKLRTLVEWLKRPDVESALVFTRTKSGAKAVHRELTKAGISCEVIHGDRDQTDRIRALEAFRQGQVPVLVATDVASRGIDVEGISHVINFDVPNSAEDYLHRIGRTARAGRTGHAVTFVTPSEEREWKRIERAVSEGARKPKEAKVGAASGGRRSGGPRSSSGRRRGGGARDGERSGPTAPRRGKPKGRTDSRRPAGNSGASPADEVKDEVKKGRRKRRRR